MAPALECGCGKKWKTGHEPATPNEMLALMGSYSAHNLENIRAASASILYHKGKGAHKIKWTYHDTTPTKGFERAEVV